ncbi:MAG TPA: DedA family protein [Acidimicrobiales bacterium]|nr:DedA family protein [Acidimicrobiales bacterium]
MTRLLAVALPGFLNSLAPTLDHYGYWAVAAFVFLEDFGVPLPGETILIAAAVYAGAGQLNPVLVGLIAVVAAVLGDNVGFAIGHFAGRAAIVRWGRYVFLTEERLAKAERFFNHHGGKIIVAARFIEGLRQANGIVAGASEMSWLRFLPFNVLGAVLWVGTWLTVGELAGSHIDAVYHGITRYSLVALAIAVVVLGALVLRYALRRRSGSAAAPEAEQAPGTR